MPKNPLARLPIEIRMIGIPGMLHGATAEQLAMAVVQTRQLDGDDMVAAVENARLMLVEATALLERIQAGKPT